MQNIDLSHTYARLNVFTHACKNVCASMWKQDILESNVVVSNNKTLIAWKSLYAPTLIQMKNPPWFADNKPLTKL